MGTTLEYSGVLMGKDLFLTILTQIEPAVVEKVFRSKKRHMAYTEEELKKELETKEYEYGSIQI